jgi:hypothetical protein
VCVSVESGVDGNLFACGCHLLIRLCLAWVVHGCSIIGVIGLNK